MPNSLITTKLRPPPARDPRLPRPRLLELLDRGTQRNLTLIEAPAGYGKTSLLSLWTQHAAADVAWLSLDEDDNDTARFLRHLAAALQEVDETLEALGDFVGDDLGAALTTIVNDVADNVDDLVLILDDYHRIDARRVHDAVGFLLERAPAQLHLVVSGRSTPPLPLARLRVQGGLTEIRADDLRFRTEETLALSELLRLGLSDRESSELTARTEGWAAGLQLAALSLKGRSDAANFISFFTGTDPYVLGYLTEEVLLRQDDDTQTFLLLTSVLERFSAGLADAVTAGSGSLARLEQLERNGLFVAALDRQRHWYRYHALFQALLRHRLERDHPDLIPELHRRAAAWFAANDEPADALRHDLLAGDYSTAAERIEAHERAAEVRSQVAAFLGRSDGGEPLAELLAATVAGTSLEQRGRLFEAFVPSAESPPSPAQPGGEVLSEREREVLALVAAGLSNKQIARRLDISPNTVKTHTRNLFAKLNVARRTEAVARARALGLV